MNQFNPKPSHSKRRPKAAGVAISPKQFITLASVIIAAIAIGGGWLIYSLLVSSGNSASQSLDETTESDTISKSTLVEIPDNNLDRIPASLPVESGIWRSLYSTKDPLSSLSISAELDKIVAEVQALAQAIGLPAETVSVVLVDLSNQAISTYQPDQFHYPASISKLFWLTAFYAQVEQGLLNLTDYETDIALMLQKSDNNATSRIVDAITHTTTSPLAESTIPQDYQTWLSRRMQLNTFFEAAGYEGINISQKTYPITDIEIMEPVGFDQQMREDLNNPTKPIRNRLTAYQAARLMTEIATGQSVSTKASQQMFQLLARDLNQDWQSPKDYFNPVQYFFGEDLPKDARLYSKAGWTSQGRHEVAYIESSDGQQQYILSIFADHPAYGENQTFFPAAARLVYERMSQF
ncbi:serine hydrolase [Synechococcus moorigangaii CMS01]|nr:serine hydrolase [Synechococcus moorigangaii CMS01]